MTFCAAVSEGGVPVQSVSRAGQGPFLQTPSESDIMESTTRKGALLMKYDGILFDLDGTLWDSTEAVAASWKIALQGQRCGGASHPRAAGRRDGHDWRTADGHPYTPSFPPAASGAVRPVLPSGKWISAGARGASLSQPGGDLGQVPLRSCPCSLSATATRTTFPAFLDAHQLHRYFYRLGVYWTDGPAKGGKISA